MYRFGAIIQARMGSTRLPGKVLKKIGDKTILEHVVTRVREAGIQRIIIATSHRHIDEKLKEWAMALGCYFYAGCHEDNVLGRTIDAAEKYNLKHIMRVCADNPFLEWRYMTYLWKVWSELDDSERSYLTYSQFKKGCGVFTEIYNVAYLYSMREHLKPSSVPPIYLESHYKGPCLSIDTQEDLKRVRKWYENSKYNHK